MTSPSDDASLVAALVREHDFPRYAATLFAPPEKRDGLLALAAFDLELRRIPDQVSQPLPGEIRLQWWVDLLQGTEHGGAAGNPVAAELIHAVRSLALPPEPLIGMVRAHTFDLYDEPMPNRKTLNVYLDDTFGGSIATALRVLGDDPSSRDEALVRDAGRAAGLTRVLAQLPHDAARRRCFLPKDLMMAQGLSVETLFAGSDTPSLRAVRSELIAEARNHLAAACKQARRLDVALRPAVLTLATPGRELDALASQPPLAVYTQPSRLRVLWSEWRMMRR